jgi:hypothetical protein
MLWHFNFSFMIQWRSILRFTFPLLEPYYASITLVIIPNLPLIIDMNGKNIN